MIEHPDADALLAGPLGQWLAEQSALRTQTRERSHRRFMIGLAGAVLASFVTIVAGGKVMTAVLAGAGLGGLGFGWSKWTEQPVVTRLKAAINTAIAQALGLEFSTVVTDPEPFRRACRFELLPAHDDARLEDQWSGELAGQRFCLHEARLTEERGSGKQRRTVTVFAGVVMAVSFARPFSGITVVRRKAAALGLVRALFGIDTTTVAGQSLQRITMVDPHFEDSFEAWTSDPVDGHYLLNPAYVERLIGIERAFAGDRVRAVFAGGELLVALESQDLFESGGLDASDDRARLVRTIAQFGALADLAVQLNERPR